MARALQTELGRRIVAAAALNGWELKDLPAVFADYGANKHLAPRLARDPEARPLPRQLRDLCAVLNVPEEWFTADDWRSLISEESGAEGEPSTGELLAQRTELLATVAAVRNELEALRRQGGHGGHPPGGPSN